MKKLNFLLVFCALSCFLTAQKSPSKGDAGIDITIHITLNKEKMDVEGISIDQVCKKVKTFCGMDLLSEEKDHDGMDCTLKLKKFFGRKEGGPLSKLGNCEIKKVKGVPVYLKDIGSLEQK